MAEGKTMKLIDETMCATCIHKNVLEVEEPCYTCMETLINENSKKPINYIEDKKVKK